MLVQFTATDNVSTIISLERWQAKTSIITFSSQQYVCSAAMHKYAKSGDPAENFASAEFAKKGQMRDLLEPGPISATSQLDIIWKCT